MIIRTALAQTNGFRAAFRATIFHSRQPKNLDGERLAAVLTDAIHALPMVGTRTGPRTESPIIRREGKKCLSALFARAGNGTLTRHRELILPDEPPPICS
jgi:hypothetical protein